MIKMKILLGKVHKKGIMNSPPPEGGGEKREPMSVVFLVILFSPRHCSQQYKKNRKCISFHKQWLDPPETTVSIAGLGNFQAAPIQY